MGRSFGGLHAPRKIERGGASETSVPSAFKPYKPTPSPRMNAAAVTAAEIKDTIKTGPNNTLIDLYQAILKEKGNLNEKLDLIESKFIRRETGIYKRRMLSIYQKMASEQVHVLQEILARVSYGPVALHGTTIIDNNKTYLGSVMYYKYKAPVGDFYEESVLATTYKDESGFDVIKIYKTSHKIEKLALTVGEQVPLHWLTSLDEEIVGCHNKMLTTVRENGLHAVEESLQLLAFLSPNADLAPFGDIHTAITDYYDIREKLEGNGEYYWVSGEATAQPTFDVPRLVEQLREATEWYSGNTLVDLCESDWQSVQGLLQKALVALQGAC